MMGLGPVLLELAMATLGDVRARGTEDERLASVREFLQTVYFPLFSRGTKFSNFRSHGEWQLFFSFYDTVLFLAYAR